MNCAELIKSKSGRGLVVFSDPAGAKACLAFAWLLKHNGLKNVKLCSNKQYSFYSAWNLDIEIIPDLYDVALDGIDWVFAGTSHPDSSNCYEIGIISRARDKGIFTQAFIDHSTSLSLRFLWKNNYVFPDTIFVTSSGIRSVAVAEGLPDSSVECIENPYLYYIQKHWKNSITREIFYKAYDIDDNVKSLYIYAPDPISLRHSIEAYGFDECTFLQELLPYFSLNPHCFLLIKTHPLQPLDKLRTLIEESARPNCFLDVQGKFDNLEMSYHSDAVIGFFSNFLLEAFLLGRPILRYFPPKNDPFEKLFENKALRCRSTTELFLHLDQLRHKDEA